MHLSFAQNNTSLEGEKFEETSRENAAQIEDFLAHFDNYSLFFLRLICDALFYKCYTPCIILQLCAHQVYRGISLQEVRVSYVCCRCSDLLFLQQLLIAMTCYLGCMIWHC